MGSWQQRIKGNALQVVCIQETHVNSDAEAEELAAMWARMWNLHVDEEKPLSFWTVTTTRTAGVGILLHPTCAGKYTRQDWVEAEGRGLLITSPTDGIMNIYAPNFHPERKVFFEKVQTALDNTPERMLLLGDFNCVRSPANDRITAGQWATGTSESKELDALVEYWRLEDAFLSVHQSLPAVPDAATLTYWHQGHGARLDRGYATPSAVKWLAGAEVRPPGASTDHNGLLLWMRDPQLQPLRTPLSPLAYPIRGRDPVAIADEVRHAVQTVATAACRTNSDWDTTAAHRKEEMRAIKRRERKRATKALKKWRRRMRKHIHTLADVIEYEKRRVEKRLQLRRGTRLGTVAGKSLLHRISERTRSPITTLLAPPSLATASLADKMAVAWEPLLSHSHATSTATVADLYTIPDDKRIQQEVSEALTRETDLEEVLAIIGATGEHKAAGDDRLNNDFFRDHKEELAPYLVVEFNRILQGGELPASYGAAVIVPLPKNGNSANPMDYRPIALLQSSYKLLTKLVAFRLRLSLGQIINEDQRGFVRGRQMADNIRIMQALLQQEFEFDDDSAERSPAILFIDFKKAYDSLDRAFLFTALQNFGFDENFVSLIQRLHTGTTARFLVNGELSSVVEVNTGIRQGCPLAPLLFLIAVETLKYAVDKTPGLRGIALEGPTATIVHNWSAFVDDSVVFVEAGAMLHELQNTLDEFAAVSGLQIQPAKSQLVLLNPRCQMPVFAGFPVLVVGDTVRYLGILIGLGDLSEPNWRQRLSTIKIQLGLAARFMSSVPDRVVVLNAVAIPSLLFTAKFYTPSPSILAEIDQLWKQFLWQGTVSRRPLRSHKISMSIISQHPTDLGLGVQDPKVAMVAQAARSVLEWNTKTHDKTWAAMHMIICEAKGCPPTTKLHTYPSARQGPSVSTLTGKTDLLSLGWDMVLRQTTTRYPIEKHLLERRAACIQALERASPCVQWITSSTGQFCIPPSLRQQWTDTALRNYTAMAPELRAFWSTFPWADNAWVTDVNGQSLQKRAFPNFTKQLLGDVNIRFQGNGTFLFQKPIASSARISTTGLETIARWVWTLIVSVGIHVADHAGISAASRVYNIQQHPIFDQYEWQVAGGGIIKGRALDQKWHPRDTDGVDDLLTARVGGWGCPVEFMTASGSAKAHDDLKQLQDPAGSVVVLAGHPEIHHGPVLTRIYHRLQRPLDKAAIKAAIRPTPTQVAQRQRQGVTLVCGRLERNRKQHPEVFGAMQSSTPRQLTASIDGLSVYQQLFRYRLLLGALNPRVGDAKNGPCPHASCLQHEQPVTISHIVWECDAAKAAWTSVISAWTQRSITTLADVVFACFKPEAPVLSRSARQELADAAGDWPTTLQAVSALWTVVSTITTQQLWLIRNDSIFRAAVFPTQEIVARIWKTIQGQTSSLAYRLQADETTQAMGRCIRTLTTILTKDFTIAEPIMTEVRLYYDGGARGNPGCSGAGSVIIERRNGTSWEIVWWQATYCGASQTNNYAEHIGAATGLEECARRYGNRACTVRIIGDSTLVTQQLRGRAAIRTSKLLRPWSRAMDALASLYSYECLHTRRAGNKMADYLANIAMNETASRHWEAPHLICSTTHELYKLLHGDVSSEISTLQPPPILELHLRAKLERFAPSHESAAESPAEPPQKKAKKT